MQAIASVLRILIDPAFLSLIRESQVDQADHVGKEWGKEGTWYYGCPQEAPFKFILFWKEKKKKKEDSPEKKVLFLFFIERC